MEQQQNDPKTRLLVDSPTKTTASVLLAAVAAMTGVTMDRFLPREKPAKNYPQPQCSPRSVIAAWNKEVAARGDRLDRIANRRRDRNIARAFADSGQRPKFAPQRTHKQHKHPLRDEHGAYTLVGRNLDGSRRIWLAGISAQRGY